MLHNALTAAGAHSTRYVLEGAGHGDLSFLGDSKSGLPWSGEPDDREVIVGFPEKFDRRCGALKPRLRSRERRVPYEPWYRQASSASSPVRPTSHIRTSGRI